MKFFLHQLRIGSRSRYVPAIDGLRALSVVAVLFYHADVAALSGGFLGVEVFFVISSYLITSLLLAEHRRHGSIDFQAFLLRRARRILPALLAVLCFAIVLSYTCAPDAFADTRADLAGALLFLSNWWQVWQEQSYFLAAERPPLLRHLWSLAVEEQFYLLWPLLFVWSRGALQPRRLLLVTLSLALLSSAWLLSLSLHDVEPARLYVGTDTRLAGLMIGAALAVYGPLQSERERVYTQRSRVALDVASALGLLTLGWSLFAVSAYGTFVFRGGLLLLDLATAALILGASVPNSASARALSWAPLVWIGKRSYGLYLWHWPVFAVTRSGQDVELEGTALLALRLAICFVLAELSYRGIEMPVRRGALQRLWAGFLLEKDESRARLSVLFAASLGLYGATFFVLSASAALPRSDPAPQLDGTSEETSQPTLGSAQEPDLEPPSELQTALTAPAAALREQTGSPLSRNRLKRSQPGPLVRHEVEPTAHAKAVRPSFFGSAPLDPSSPRSLTLLTDSVALGVRAALPNALSGWNVEVLGRPALMIKHATREFLPPERKVGAVVVIGLGYNSLFERERRTYDRWAQQWDREATQLLHDLRARGAQRFVWITLREPSLSVLNERGRRGYERAAWYFPYVNERIRKLAALRNDVRVADWAAVSNIPNLTGDAIHLNGAGIQLMTQTITGVVRAQP